MKNKLNFIDYESEEFKKFERKLEEEVKLREIEASKCGKNWDEIDEWAESTLDYEFGWDVENPYGK